MLQNKIMSVYTLNTFSLIWVQKWICQVRLALEDCCVTRVGIFISVEYLFLQHTRWCPRRQHEWSEQTLLSEPQHVGYINEWAMTCHISCLGRMALLGASWEANKPSGNKAYVHEKEMDCEERRRASHILMFSFSIQLLFTARQMPLCHLETHCMLCKEIRIRTRWSC